MVSQFAVQTAMAQSEVERFIIRLIGTDQTGLVNVAITADNIQIANDLIDVTRNNIVVNAQVPVQVVVGAIVEVCATVLSSQSPAVCQNLGDITQRPGANVANLDLRQVQ